MLKKQIASFALALAAGAAWSAPIAPAFDDFGALPAATFGGSGIPNDAVAVDRFTGLGGTITLGLTAHQRYDNPALTHDGAGTFQASVGVDTHAPSSASDPWARWNVGYYVDIGTDLGAVVNFFTTTFSIFYDFTPSGSATAFSGSTPILPFQDSRNLGDDWLFLSAFDPDAAGEYSFALVAYDLQAREVGRAAIRVVVNAVPEPASLALVGVALLGLAGMRRRRA